MPASVASSSRRSPGVWRRPPPAGRPTSSGVSRARQAPGCTDSGLMLPSSQWPSSQAAGSVEAASARKNMVRPAIRDHVDKSMAIGMAVTGASAAIGPCTGCRNWLINDSSLRRPRTRCAVISHTQAIAATAQNAWGTARGSERAGVASVHTSASPVRPKPIARVFSGNRVGAAIDVSAGWADGRDGTCVTVMASSTRSVRRKPLSALRLRSAPVRGQSCRPAPATGVRRWGSPLLRVVAGMAHRLL